MSGFLRVVTLEVAKARLAEYWKAKPRSQVLAVEGAVGRWNCSDMKSGLDLPPFDRATFDGYAVIASDTFRASENKPVKLSMSGRVATGAWPKIRVKRGSCVGISTGGAMPSGSNAVVMSEDTVLEGSEVRISRAVSPFENVTKRGSDVAKGQTVVLGGKRLNTADIAVLAAIGADRICVRAKPRVAIISTGSELVKAGRYLPSGKVYDVNGPSLMQVVRTCGAEAKYLGIARDNATEISRFVRKVSLTMWSWFLEAHPSVSATSPRRSSANWEGRG